MKTSPWRVTVVDDHSLFAEAVVLALRGPSLHAQCVVPDGETTFAQLARAIVSSNPDLVLLDLDLGVVGDVMKLVTVLAGSGISIVVVTGSTDRVRHGEALSSGARSVIAKTSPFAEIVDTAGRIRNGLPAMPRGERDELLASYRAVAESQRELRQRFHLMTRREAEVLGRLMAGEQVTEIARARFVSESTVRTQVKSILAKLQVSSQLTAVGLAHKLGWQPPRADSDETTGPIRRPTRPRRPVGSGLAAAG
ncbi:MAG TPA: LuxR C-terminal-related transcriptional regulator [Nocardioides sp.]|jgi:two-component system, NarL family, nitrate/nitrite response regulator NarL|nr:LuxR C-terminal-related transcriptional regulator [Nocardioides sp.]